MHTVPFGPLRRVDGYLPIEDHGLIGDGESAALVGRDGAISWLCVPQFDDPPLFAALLDAEIGGYWCVAPEQVVESRQHYLGETGVLVTELRAPGGLVRLTDAMALRRGANLAENAVAARGALVRRVEVLEGAVRLQVDIRPRGGGGLDAHAAGWHLQVGAMPDLKLQLDCERPLTGRKTTLDVAAGDRVHMVLRWSGLGRRTQVEDISDLMDATLHAWQRWQAQMVYRGPRPDLARRSAITLKLLDHLENGAMVAAPTSSLPEAIGGVRNWDYRFAWVRDVAFSVYAMSRIGLERESAGFLAWLLDIVDEHGGLPRVLYTLNGRSVQVETIDPALAGYRRSAPVRWGNAAGKQNQHDVAGEILDCAYLWSKHGGAIDPKLWRRLRPMVEAARRLWDEPDYGPWEVRGAPQRFTYSAAMCQVAVDRGARLAERLGLAGDSAAWRADAAKMRYEILERAWSARIGAFAGQLDGDTLDASVLALPLRRVVARDDPRLAATADAIATHLSAGNGLLYRYLPGVARDGLPDREGAFLLCSFWLVDNLTIQGRLDEAVDLFESLCTRANALGLLPEQIDPATGSFLGNFPQAFSHVGLISSGVALGAALAARER